MAPRLQRRISMTWTLLEAVTLAVGAQRQPAVAARRLRETGLVDAGADLRSVWDALGFDPRAFAPARDRAAELVARCRATGDHVVGWTCAAYPPALRSLPDPPLALWVRGDPAVLSRPAVAVVGSRAARSAAVEVSTMLATDLARCGLVVVSGLARGVDAAAHRGALATGRTAAVLGTGIDIVYPGGHRALADAVATAGALVSEFLPGTPPRAHHFPLRNRILSGLVRAVVVVEASERSGSLITARLAAEQGREVMVVPGDVRGGANRGGHALLRDGARLVEQAADVLDELGWHPRPLRSDAEAGEAEAGAAVPAVLEVLQRTGGLPLDELSTRLGTAPPLLLRDLLDFELAGRVVRDGTGRFLPAERKW